MSDRMPEDLPDRKPEELPASMPEDMSDSMAEDLPERKCINVMVGITRSKVFFFCQWIILEIFML
jgi:uridine phosphorylase